MHDLRLVVLCICLLLLVIGGLGVDLLFDWFVVTWVVITCDMSFQIVLVAGLLVVSLRSGWLLLVLCVLFAVAVAWPV